VPHLPARSHFALGLILGTLVVSAVVVAQTQGNDVLPYQGRIEHNGVGLNGDATLTFRLYDDATAGAQLDTFTRAVVAAAGHFATTLGPLSQATLDAEEVWVEVDVNGAPLQGRQAIRSTLQSVRATFGETFQADAIDVGTLTATTVNATTVGAGVVNATTVNSTNVNSVHLDADNHYGDYAQIGRVDTEDLRVQDDDNAADPDIATFYAQNGTQGVGIGYNRVAALGNNANQDLHLLPRGTGRVNLGCPSDMADVGAFCIDTANSSESTYGDAYATCAGRNKVLCSYREVCSAISRSLIPNASYGVSDLMFYTGNNRHYRGGPGGSNSVVAPSTGCSALTPGPQGGTVVFRCCM